MPPDLPALIRRWLNHRDEAAAKTLIDHLYPLVSRVVRRHATGRDSPEDLAQESFARLFQNLHRYDPSQPIENWISRITLNVCRNHWRHQSGHPELHWENLSPTEQSLAEHAWNADKPLPSSSNEDAHALMFKLLQTLAPDDRLVLSLLHLEEKTTDQIAELTGWSRTLVKVRAYRARQKLRRAMEHLKP
jgi:RNA polymerase sigma-70 factor, ECF subfamily